MPNLEDNRTEKFHQANWREAHQYEKSKFDVEGTQCDHICSSRKLYMSEIPPSMHIFYDNINTLSG